MPGERTRTTAAPAPSSALTFAVEQQGRLVWVSLSGILDRDGLHRLIQRLGAPLAGPGRRVVLDGRRLTHVDYRVVASLIRWRGDLDRRGHRLDLAGWNSYLQAILAVEDWRGELAPAGAYWSSWRMISGAQRTRQP
jgi:ABC-type transporter Mla MlaB component